MMCCRDWCWVPDVYSLDENARGKISKFVNDTNFGNVVDTEELATGSRSTEKMGKEKVDGKLNQTMTQGILGRVVEQRDYVVQVHSSLIFVTHLDRMVKKAYGTLTFIGQSIEHVRWDVIFHLYKTV